jgi:threonine dehydrogenase-like Zn-dependent dehydrogenase
MKAAVFYGPHDLRVENVEKPETGPDDVLLKVIACGICGSDLHSYKRGLYVKPGQIMGHELIGQVVSVGQNISDIRIGQRMTGFYVRFCGSCIWCKSRQYMLCPNLYRESTGFGFPGAFAEYVKIPDARLGRNIHAVPDEIDDLTAATIEPVGVAAYTVSRCGPKPSDKVVILGGGMIGNTVLQIMKTIPVALTVMTEISDIKLALAKASGADVLVHAGREPVMERIKETVGIGPYHFGEGAMADIVVEAAGVPETIEQTFEMVRSGGVIAFVGLPEKKASIDITKIVHKSPTILGCLGGNTVKAIDLLKTGQVRTRHLISRVFPLAEIKEAFEYLLHNPEAIKVVVSDETRLL